MSSSGIGPTSSNSKNSPTFSETSETKGAAKKGWETLKNRLSTKPAGGMKKAMISGAITGAVGSVVAGVIAGAVAGGVVGAGAYGVGAILGVPAGAIVGLSAGLATAVPAALLGAAIGGACFAVFDGGKAAIKEYGAEDSAAQTQPQSKREFPTKRPPPAPRSVTPSTPPRSPAPIVTRTTPKSKRPNFPPPKPPDFKYPKRPPPLAPSGPEDSPEIKPSPSQIQPQSTRKFPSKAPPPIPGSVTPSTPPRSRAPIVTRTTPKSKRPNFSPPKPPDFKYPKRPPPLAPSKSSPPASSDSDSSGPRVPNRRTGKDEDFGSFSVPSHLDSDPISSPSVASPTTIDDMKSQIKKNGAYREELKRMNERYTYLDKEPAGTYYLQPIGTGDVNKFRVRFNSKEGVEQEDKRYRMEIQRDGDLKVFFYDTKAEAGDNDHQLGRSTYKSLDAALAAIEKDAQSLLGTAKLTGIK